MNSNPYALPAFIVCVAVLFGCSALAFLAVTKPAGQHARRRDPGPEARQFAGELRGEPPVTMTVTYDASQAIGQLHGIHDQLREIDPSLPDWRNEPDGVPDLDWWKQLPPAPPAVEILAGPGTASPQTSEVAIGVLARVRDALMPDAWRTPPGEATFTPADPDATCTDLPAVQDAPQYLAAPQ